MNLSMKDLKSEDVDELYGLILSVAFAIYVEGWKWFEFPNTTTPILLLDAPLPANKVPDKDCGRYVGDNYYVFKDLPKYHESLRRMNEHGQKLLDAGYVWDYCRYIEEELKTSDHAQLLHCSAETRCRAILKLYLDNPQIMKEMEIKK